MFLWEGTGAMTEVQHLQKEILQLTETIKDDENSVRTRAPDVNRDVLLQAIAVRKTKLAALKQRLAALRHS
jgi:hypothetical protein